jgi:signal transduction histidine kinase
MALVVSTLLYLVGRLTPVRYGTYGSSWASEQFFHAVGEFLVGMVALAPLVALRWLFPAIALVLAGLLPTLVGSAHAWPLTIFAGMVGVAMCAVWRSPRLAWVAAGAAVAAPVFLRLGSTLVMPDGAEVRLDYEPGRSWLITVGMYAVGVAIAVGAAQWLRLSASRALDESALAADRQAVQDEAAVVAERARLARDLHDVVAHHVSLIAVRAETALYTHAHLSPEARDVLGDIAGDARQALEELRSVLGILGRSDSGTDRAPQPSLTDIPALVDRARTAGTDVTMTGDPTTPVSANAGYVGYRVVQEALTNARRHASGRPVTVSIAVDATTLSLRIVNEVADTGSSSSAGTGLAGMRERVVALGGQFSAGRDGSSFEIAVTLPRGAA